ncbi:MAG: transcriptional regulator NrdR [Candidatus Woesearchaeota archaeon]
MRCSYCNHDETKVLETRETGEDITRRRRECLKCSKRFTTYEQVEITNITIIKKDGKRAIFDRQKLVKSMQIACQKRPVNQDKIEEMASKIERSLRNSSKNELPSSKIGQLVMKELKKVDEVAYIRFASVYREFKDLQSFRKELEKLNA